MFYLLETKLSENYLISVALVRIYGIGKSSSSFICKKLGFLSNLKVKKLTQRQTTEILEAVKSLNLILNAELKRLELISLKKLISMRSYRGLRIVRGLPVRGQRTRTNCKSSRKMLRFSNLRERFIFY